ncbi:tail fiber assembly protein [Citrobacter freundii]|uniref:tail fiber assembly protein n=1 Tax=Citrobacter TaxID=544 RepID=UPI0021B4D34F|nr:MULTISPECIES: tail fiber assembly protein [Citrobacter]MDV1856422.1 tail fiber assembly protein [Citrobacter freundii]MEB0417616.1 tail fiber assembly protein [Citrobacter freundii]
MKPVFDENGLANEAGDIRCFYFNPVTFEYTGWSDEYINVGVSMPGHSTDIDPGDEVAGKVAVFKSGAWSQEEDHRGEIVYSITDGMPSTIDYIGPVHDGYTTTAPSGSYDKWDGEKWVTDTDVQHAADKEVAKQQQQSLIDSALASIGMIQLKLQAGRKLTTAETTRLNSVLDYIDAVEATDTSTAPDINWPLPPEW